MAKIQLGAFVTDIRNKVGGSVFSKNRAGAYVRNKVTPVNPSTVAQGNSRSRFTGFSQGWRGLTSGQQSQWRDATSSFPKTDQFGNIYYLSGAQLYQSLNNSLKVVGASAITAPPVPSSVEAVTSATLTMTKGTPSASLAFAPSPVPANTAFMIYATPGVSPGVSFVKNQYRLIGVISSADTTPEDILSAYTAKYGLVPAAGQRVYIKLVPVNTVTGQQGIGYETSSIVGA